MSKVNILSIELGELIAKELIKEGISFVGKDSGLYGRIQKIASDLGIIEYKSGIERGTTYILSDRDYLRVMDKIWYFILKGYIAPGRNILNPWFPNVHLTEEGKKYRDELLQKEENSK